jgi:hypothetical protein
MPSISSRRNRLLQTRPEAIVSLFEEAIPAMNRRIFRLAYIRIFEYT